MIVLDCPNPACARRHEVSDFLARLTIVCTSCQTRIFVDPAKTRTEEAKPVVAEQTEASRPLEAPKPRPRPVAVESPPPAARPRWTWIAGGAVAVIALIGGAYLINEMTKSNVEPEKKIEIAVVPKVDPKPDVDAKKTPEVPTPVPPEVKDPEPTKEPDPPKVEPKEAPAPPKQNAGPQLGGPNPFTTRPAKKLPRADRLARNAGLITKEIFKKWDTALEDDTGDGFEDARTGVQFLSDFERLFDATGFREAESGLLIKRMRLVPEEEVEEFQKVNTLEIPRLDEEQAALVILIQQDALFKSTKFDSALAKLFRDRLQALPKAVLESAASVNVLGLDSAMDASTVAAALASYDALWIDNQFQAKVWQAMLKKHLSE